MATDQKVGGSNPLTHVAEKAGKSRKTDVPAFFVWCIPNGEFGVIGEPFGEMRRFEKDMRGMIRWKIPNPGDIAGNA